MRADFARARRVRPDGATAQQDRHDEIVGDRDCERDAVDHHHAGRRGEPAEHRRQREAARAGGERQGENRQIAVDRAVGESRESGDRQRRDEQIDQHEIDGEQPRRGDDIARIAILDDADVKLARQQQDRRRREQRRGQPIGRIGGRLDHRADARVGLGDARQFADPAGKTPDDERAHGEKGHQLDDGFDRNGQDQPVLMLGRIDAPRAEGHGEGRQHHRHREIEGRRRRAGRQSTVFERVDDHQDGLGDRLELQRDIGRGGHQRDERGERRHRLGLAVARGHEIGDRRQVLRARERGDARHQPMAEPDDEDRPDIDRQEIEPMRRSEPDRAVIGPGGAVDGQAQRIDERALFAHDEPPPAVIAPPGHGEKEADIAEGRDEDSRTVQHGAASRGGMAGGIKIY